MSKQSKAYKHSELAEIRELAGNATRLMLSYIDEHNLQDGGTCVLGEGIDVLVLPPRCKIPRYYQIVSQPFQGNNERALRVAMAYLVEQGVDCVYNHGRMD